MDDQLRTILEEIRDTQREHLAEYRRVAERSVSLQKEAVERQRQIATLYRKVVLVAAVVVAAGIAFIVYAVSR